MGIFLTLGIPKFTVAQAGANDDVTGSYCMHEYSNCSMRGAGGTSCQDRADRMTQHPEWWNNELSPDLHFPLGNPFLPLLLNIPTIKGNYYSQHFSSSAMEDTLPLLVQEGKLPAHTCDPVSRVTAFDPNLKRIPIYTSSSHVTHRHCQSSTQIHLYCLA